LPEKFIINKKLMRLKLARALTEVAEHTYSGEIHLFVDFEHGKFGDKDFPDLPRAYEQLNFVRFTVFKPTFDVNQQKKGLMFDLLGEINQFSKQIYDITFPSDKKAADTFESSEHFHHINLN
ncbi:MAG: hypothetical protein KC713_09500, partial [Candidatus Omnitrophica bacterium]|nr:hypothetical protein [Candidatus Omnitrophota bacterium]